MNPRVSETPWLPPEAARPLRSWTDHQLHALAASLTHAAIEWRKAWALPLAETRFTCQAAGRDANRGSEWHELGDTAGGLAWLDRGEAFERELTDALFLERHEGSSIAVHVTTAAAHDFTLRIASAIGLVPAARGAAAPDARYGAPWSGAVEARLSGILGCRILVSAHVMEAWCTRLGLAKAPASDAAARAALTRMEQALADRRVRFEARLIGCDIEVAALQELQVGDVVRLPHRLEAPGQLIDEEGQTVFGAYLGRHGDVKVVELVKVADSTAAAPQFQSNKVPQ